jgi:hypothetical protein
MTWCSSCCITAWPLFDSPSSRAGPASCVTVQQNNEIIPQHIHFTPISGYNLKLADLVSCDWGHRILVTANPGNFLSALNRCVFMLVKTLCIHKRKGSSFYSDTWWIASHQPMRRPVEQTCQPLCPTQHSVWSILIQIIYWILGSIEIRN